MIKLLILFKTFAKHAYRFQPPIHFLPWRQVSENRHPKSNLIAENPMADTLQYYTSHLKPYNTYSSLLILLHISPTAKQLKQPNRAPIEMPRFFPPRYPLISVYSFGLIIRYFRFSVWWFPRLADRTDILPSGEDSLLEYWTTKNESMFYGAISVIFTNPIIIK